MERWSSAVAAKATNQYSSTPLLHHSISLFLEADAVVGLEVIEESALHRIKSESRAFAVETFSFLGVRMRAVGFDSGGPGVALYLNRRLLYYFRGRSSALTLWPLLPNGNPPPTKIGHSH